MQHKYWLTALAIGLASGVGYAQKSKINEASRELDNVLIANTRNDLNAEAAALQKAKAAIDEAVGHEKTANNAEAWMTKAAVYVGLQKNSQTNANNPYKEALAAYNKALEINPKLKDEQQTVNIAVNLAFMCYNDGIELYNDRKYTEATNTFDQFGKLTGADKDPRFKNWPNVDTLRAENIALKGYSLYYDNKFSEAANVLSQAVASPYIKDKATAYLLLSFAYQKLEKPQEQIKALEAGRKAYPNDKNLVNAEIDFYIQSNQHEQMISKLNDAIAKEPQNPVYAYNLALIYEGMANPTDKPAPANANEYYTKAEENYKKVIAIAPKNPTYNYQIGAFYFNQAVGVNKVMDNLGSSSADLAKYEKLKVSRDALMDKSAPYLENAISYFKPYVDKLNPEEKRFYRDAASALSKIYALKDQLDKSKAMRELSESVQ